MTFRTDPYQEQDDIRQLKAGGHKAIAKQYEAMASALKVIHTWATCDEDEFKILNPGNVIPLCEKALRRFQV